MGNHSLRIYMTVNQAEAVMSASRKILKDERLEQARTNFTKPINRSVKSHIALENGIKAIEDAVNNYSGT